MITSAQYKNRGVRHDFESGNDGHIFMCKVCGLHESYPYHSGVLTLETIEPPKKNIAEEAMSIVYGDREQAYDTPHINFEKTALMWTGHLLKRLNPNGGSVVQITATDVAIMMAMLKLSREGFKPNRENRVDAIGYILCEDRIVNDATE